ncbi:hypothetical protein [Actinoplanes solisilvae]|uniref:hypothetical protein n=1 Tax=Actinoplanes solisilvae TaxID=2486853 RepID=UPI000FDBA3EE|nr:hypothetical protein [Actinoplanes solisilvae]
MSVMVGEMHTSVVQDSTAAPGPPTPEPGPQPPGVTEQQWRAARRRAEHLARRVRAENFDD